MKFVAEVSSNHNQDLTRCLEFVDSAASIGCDAVKFQLFKIDELFTPEVLTQSKMHRDRKAWELPVEFLAPIANRCVDAGIEFACTPFYLGAVDELLPYVSFYKVASYELLWNDLLVACAKTGKPVVLSTGNAGVGEIDDAVGVLGDAGCMNVTLLHCISAYPTSPDQCNLAAIETLRVDNDVSVGWSDHSVNSGVIFRAVHRWKASMVEFHLDLDGKGAEYGIGHCWLPEDIALVIASVRAGLSADGDGVKGPVPSEAPDREWRADPSDGLRPLKSLRDRERELNEFIAKLNS